MGKLNDLTGKRFGRLTVIKKIGAAKNRQILWLCKCDCGKEKIIIGSSLKNGYSTSCGCYAKEIHSKNNSTHNCSKNRLYNVWALIKQRVYNKNNKEYADYGGRGITICKEWSEDFMSFFKWAYANGYDENAKKGECTIDRINVNGNYEPSNCRWVAMKIQNLNKRNNKILSLNGESHTISEWEKITGIGNHLIAKRLKLGWSIEKTLTTPIKTKKGN